MKCQSPLGLWIEWVSFLCRKKVVYIIAKKLLLQLMLDGRYSGLNFKEKSPQILYFHVWWSKVNWLHISSLKGEYYPHPQYWCLAPPLMGLMCIKLRLIKIKKNLCIWDTFPLEWERYSWRQDCKIIKGSLLSFHGTCSHQDQMTTNKKRCSNPVQHNIL